MAEFRVSVCKAGDSSSERKDVIKAAEAGGTSDGKLTYSRLQGSERLSEKWEGRSGIQACV